MKRAEWIWVTREFDMGFTRAGVNARNGDNSQIDGT